MSVQDEIHQLVKETRVVLFMKGSRMAPQCGFSARAVDILDEYLDDYRTVDVLADPRVREAVKEFSAWPTIPQLYVDAKFVGGSDIIHEMTKSGELSEVLGMPRIDMIEPKITLTKSAEGAFIRFWEAEGDTEEPVVRLTLSSNWEPLLDLDQERDGDLVLDMGELDLVMTRSTARRADGVKIDYIERGGHIGFKVDVPKKPPMVGQLSVEDLQRWIEEGKPHLLVDVRSPEERATAKLESAVAFADVADDLEQLDRDKTIVFMCHHGMRSAQAANHMLAKGFRDVHNLQGGIDAWSLHIDPDLPRY
ncbi:MAG: Grx4 family monothiol glutaredoxin [Sandaracinaceae bacterium]|nr:Grx4 family monothiol glutaredoxin [Sandaracinaceae bacterium]